MASYDIRNKPDAGRFETQVDGKNCILVYRLTGEVMAVTHTEVPPELEGRGIGGALAQAALEYARDHNLKVVPLCSFVEWYIQKHPEFQNLVVYS